MNNNNNEVTTTEQGQDKGGRPSKYEPKTIERLLSAMSDGLTLKQACRVAGISETTLSRWREEHPELVPQLERAREQTRQDALASINKAGENDWRAKKAFLELSFQEYRQPGTKIEVNNQQAHEAVKVLITPEQRRAMIEAREQLLSGKAELQPELKQSLPGTPIGSIRVPADDSQPNTEQRIVQPGQSFTPFVEPHGVSEAALKADLYGWQVVKEKRQ